MRQHLEKLSSRGYKITPQRRLILEVIEASDKHLNVDELCAQIRQMQPSVSLATIYRNLKIMHDLGLINRLDLQDSPSRYQINKGHNHHLVCIDCGQAIKLDICPMDQAIKVIESSGFKVFKHQFEVTGSCSNCQLIANK